MAKLLQLRRGNTSAHGSFTGAVGEVTIDTDKDVPVVHDGSTAGGHPAAAEDLANVSSASIVGRIGTSALAGVKVQPNFGSQNVETTGTLSSGDLTVTSATPVIHLVDSDNNSDFSVYGNGGAFTIYDTTNTADRLKIDSSGTVDIFGNLDVGSGIDVTGNITTTGNISAGDNDHLYLGDGSDINIYHDGTDSYFYTGAGTAFFRTAANHKLASFIPDGAVELFHANGKKLETTSYGAAVSGILASTGDIKITNDTGKFVSGASDDLQIYHDGNHSRIDDVGTGSLLIQTNGTDVQINKGTSETMAKFTPDGAVELFYDQGTHATAKLATSATGVSVTGALTATGDVTAFSDQTLKKDITTINDALGLCGKLRGVSYKWIKDDKPSIGVIAQEIEQHIPEIVTTTQLDGKDVKSVDYGKIVGVLINAVNELKAELDQHKAEYEDLTIENIQDKTQEELNKLVLVQRKTS